MKIHEFVWPKDRIDHIARHAVSSEEFEEACFGKALVQRAKSKGANPVFTCSDQQRADDTYSVWPFNFLMAKDTRLRPAK